MCCRANALGLQAYNSVSALHMQCDLTGPQLQCSRMEVAGGPVFSLQRGIKTKITDVNVKPREPVLFCGLASKEITALRPDTLTFSQQVSQGRAGCE